MLDAGLTLPQEQSRGLELLRTVEPAGWNSAPEAAFLRSGITAGAEGIPLKLAWASDFPYRTLPGATALECDGVHTQPSLARGGFSNVWGSSMLPYIDADLAKWPIRERDLAPHYKAVFEHVPLGGREDSLEDIFPLHGAPAGLPVSRQARSLLDRLDRRRGSLAARHIFAGASRLGVRGNCHACGLCMYGCPSGLIYSSAQSLEELRAHPNFTYSPGVYCTHVGESGGRACVGGFEIGSGAAFQTAASRVFLAGGVIGTTAILLRSLNAYSQPVTLADSQYFLQPAITLSGAGAVTTEHLHTLAQAFIEIMDPAVSPFTVHFQLYTYNELYAQAVAASAGPLAPLVPKNLLLSRLLLLQGYLHSDESPSMTCQLERSGPAGTLRISRRDNPATSATIRRAVNKLLGVSAITGLVPLPPLLRPGQPGRGFHSGGSFPMSGSPSGFASDVLGRPAGFARIHAVDSSVFPSVPATTITLTAMANAHRIGALAAEL